jgi:hypothetical protein
MWHRFDAAPMADDSKQTLHTQLWNIANTLRGKMGAD